MKKLLVKYTISGMISITVQFSFLSFLVEVFSMNETLASAFAFILAGVINYLMLYHWAFQSNGKHLHIATRYTVVIALTLGLNTFLFWVMTEPLQIWYMYSQYTASIIVAAVNFLINKYYTFS